MSNYATLLYVATNPPVVTFTTLASLTPGPTFTVNSTNLIAVTRQQVQADGAVLLNFLSTSNRTYYVQYTRDLKNWSTSPFTASEGKRDATAVGQFRAQRNESTPKSVPYRFYRVVAP